MAIQGALASGAASTAAAIVGSVFDKINPSRQNQLRAEVLEKNITFVNDLASNARGKFTPQQMQQMRQANAPIVNQTQAALTQRGLGGTAGAQAVVNQARHAPFAAATQAAQANLPTALQGLQKMIPAAGPGFAQTLQKGVASVMHNYIKLKGLQALQLDPDALNFEDDPVMQEGVKSLLEIEGIGAEDLDFSEYA